MNVVVTVNVVALVVFRYLTENCGDDCGGGGGGGECGGDATWPLFQLTKDKWRAAWRGAEQVHVHG